MHRLRQYTLYYSVELFTKHDPLRYLSSKLALIGKISKWQMLLSEFDISFVSQNAIKGQALVDHLTENPFDGSPNKSQAQFPDKDILVTEADEETSPTSKWKMYFDGVANVHGCGIGAVLMSPEGD